MSFRKSIDRTFHSPNIYGKSNRAQFAESCGMLSELELSQELKLPRTVCREFFSDSEWHHVEHNGKIIKAYYCDMPELKELRRVKRIIKIRKAMKKIEKKCALHERSNEDRERWGRLRRLEVEYVDSI